jgi:hypothetical protein
MNASKLEDISTRNVYSSNGKWEEETNSRMQIFLVDDEPDLCMIDQNV